MFIYTCINMCIRMHIYVNILPINIPQQSAQDASSAALRKSDDESATLRQENEILLKSQAALKNTHDSLRSANEEGYARVCVQIRVCSKYTHLCIDCTKQKQLDFFKFIYLPTHIRKHLYQFCFVHRYEKSCSS